VDAIGLDPNYSYALYNIAILHDIYLQDTGKALEYYNRYLALVTDDAATRSWVEHLNEQQSR
jgi:uncharacterized protein YdbL (DUF1318 family)